MWVFPRTPVEAFLWSKARYSAVYPGFKDVYGVKRVKLERPSHRQLGLGRRSSEFLTDDVEKN